MADRNILMKEITEVSFFLDDLRLYLDTHPLDEKALDLYEEKQKVKKDLLAQYADEYDPLTCNCICLETNGSDRTGTSYPRTRHFTWGDGPIPWDASASGWAVTNIAFLKGGK